MLIFVSKMQGFITSSLTFYLTGGILFNYFSGLLLNYIIHNQGKHIGSLQQVQKKDNAKLLKLISLYSDLATCGVMDGKRKENLKAEIIDLINEK